MTLSGHQLPLLQPLLKWRQPKAGEWRWFALILICCWPTQGLTSEVAQLLRCIKLFPLHWHALHAWALLEARASTIALHWTIFIALHWTIFIALQCIACQGNWCRSKQWRGGGGAMQWVKRGGGASSIRTRVSLIGGGMSPACATHNVYYTYTHIHTDIHRYTHNVYYTYTHRYTHKYTDIHICKYIYIYIYHICRFMCCFHDFYEKVYDHHHDGGGDQNDNLCRIEKCYLREPLPIWDPSGRLDYHRLN